VISDYFFPQIFKNAVGESPTRKLHVKKGLFCIHFPKKDPGTWKKSQIHVLVIIFEKSCKKVLLVFIQTNNYLLSPFAGRHSTAWSGGPTCLYSPWSKTVKHGNLSGNDSNFSSPLLGRHSTAWSGNPQPGGENNGPERSSIPDVFSWPHLFVLTLVKNAFFRQRDFLESICGMSIVSQFQKVMSHA